MRWVRTAVAASLVLALAGCGGDGAPAPPPRDPAVEFARSLQGTWISICKSFVATSERVTWTFGDSSAATLGRAYAGPSCSGPLLATEDREGTFAVQGPLDETLDGHDITAYRVAFTWEGGPSPSLLTLYVDAAPDPDQLFVGSCGAWDCEWVHPAEFSRRSP